MDIARTYQIPRSLLLGRQVRAETVHHYDDQGRLVRSTTVWDPLWTEDDLAWALAQRAEDAERCSGCGLPLSETTDPDAEGEYEAPLPTRCHACTALEKRREEYRESPPGLLFSVHRKQR
ncbi:MAG: hypothetical protein IRY84_01385 [Thermobispora bispora]|nr:hypothetical protein [Thermobispora bispora]